MIVDLHIHTNRSSYCSSLHPREMILRAKELGLDAVAVTEHSTMRGAQIAYEMGLELDFIVFRGLEVYTKMGDMLVFGIEGDTHHEADFMELVSEVEKCGGVIIPAHPTRGYWGHHRKFKGTYPEKVFRHAVAVETHNGSSDREQNREALELAQCLCLPSVGGSDAHLVDHVGKCVTVFEGDFSSEEELVTALRKGRYEGIYLRDACDYSAQAGGSQ